MSQLQLLSPPRSASGTSKTLRVYQREAIEAINEYYSHEEPGNGLVVIPTAGGKSLIMGTFIKETKESAPHVRMLVVTHVKELIEQNELELLGIWPEAPTSVYSAGLKRKETSDIMFAGIQSIFNKDIGIFDLILVDECHLIPVKGEGMYLKFLKAQLEHNKNCRVIGFTATPYRMGSGLLIGDGKMFDDIIYEKKVGELVEEGFLCRLVSKGAVAKPDLSGVKLRGGDYIPDQLDAAVDQQELITASVDEIMIYAAERKSWLVFCTSVAHSEHVRDEIRSRGISCEMVTGDTPDAERVSILKRLKTGELRSVTNCNVLTTGFNAPIIDFIAMLRPTKSTGLYVQMLGRGMRICPGKDNCLVLDFSGNVKEHGPIDHIRIKRGGGCKKGVDTAPAKECPECRCLLHCAIRECTECGHIFPERKLKHNRTATECNIMGLTLSTVAVSSVNYSLHQKEGKPNSLKVTYRCGSDSYSHWLCFEHQGFAQQKARTWFCQLTGELPPPTSAEVVDWLRTNNPPKPKQIVVLNGQKYPEIKEVLFDEIENSTW